MTPRRVIVNADDLGFSPGITDGILHAHREGVVTSTTLAANMPDAARAASLAAAMPSLGVGVHLNISQGPPLSIEGRCLAGPDGVMNRTAMGVIVSCLRRPRLLKAVERECEAQIRWAIDHGIRPTHLDSHRHTHAFPPIFHCVAVLARRYGIRFVRWYGEKLPGKGWPEAPARQRKISRWLNRFAPVNRLIGGDLRGTRGTLGISHTGFIDASFLARVASILPPGVTEIMVHPGFRDEGLTASVTRLLESRQTELAAVCDPMVRGALVKNNIELTHYGKLLDLQSAGHATETKSA